MFPLITGEFSEPAAVFTSLNSRLRSLIRRDVKGNVASRHFKYWFWFGKPPHGVLGAVRCQLENAWWLAIPPLHYEIASSFHIFPSWLITVHLYAVREGHHVHDEIHYYSWNPAMLLVNSQNQTLTGDGRLSWVNQWTQPEEGGGLVPITSCLLFSFAPSFHGCWFLEPRQLQGGQKTQKTG